MLHSTYLFATFMRFDFQIADTDEYEKRKSKDHLHVTA